MAEPIEISDKVVFKTFEDEIILLHLDSGVYYGLDPVGSRFWTLLEQEHDVGAALAAMAEEFDVDRATLERDCRELLGELREKGLVR